LKRGHRAPEMAGYWSGSNRPEESERG